MASVRIRVAALRLTSEDRPVTNLDAAGADFEWDVFVSHASEDKDSIARPLASELQGRGLKVWFDEFELTTGDSLRQSIEHGMSNSHHGIVIASSVFFQKYWTNNELDGFFAREDAEQRQLLLPVWHGIEKEEVVKTVPMLAGRYGSNSKTPISELAVELIGAIRKKAPQTISAARGPVVALVPELRSAAGKDISLELHNVSKIHAVNVTLEPREVNSPGVPLTGDGVSVVRAGESRVMHLRRFEPDGSEGLALFDLVYSDTAEQVLKRQRLRFFLSHDVVSMREFVALGVELASPEETYSRDDLLPFPDHADSLTEAFFFRDGFLLTGSTRWLNAVRLLELES